MHLFVDNLTNVDFSYLDSTRGLVGETWLASVVLEGALDEQGMVCDFGLVKKTLRHWLDTHLDHCLLVPTTAEQFHCEHNDETICIDWGYTRNKVDYTLVCDSPVQAITLINSDHITPSTVATWCIRQLKQHLPDSIERITLSFAPETIQHSFYHYSHGLKKHEGNCQRIAHGHRSTIEIYRNEQRDLALEQQWCAQWQDIYIGTEEDIKEQFSLEGNSYLLFNYQAQQGSFELSIPAEHCYLIHTDSTVEFIAQHIVTALKRQHPTDTFRVRAYEGLGKGAIAFSS